MVWIVPQPNPYFFINTPLQCSFWPCCLPYYILSRGWMIPVASQHARGYDQLFLLNWTKFYRFGTVTAARMLAHLLACLCFAIFLSISLLDPSICTCCPIVGAINLQLICLKWRFLKIKLKFNSTLQCLNFEWMQFIFYNQVNVDLTRQIWNQNEDVSLFIYQFKITLAIRVVISYVM